MHVCRAAVLSVLLHGFFFGTLLWLCAGTQGTAFPSQLEALAYEPILLDDRIDVDLAPLGDPYPALRDGDGTRSAQGDEAPSRFPGRDPQPAATANGEGAGVRARLDWTGRRDEQTLHTQLANATDGYSAQRIRTSSKRASDNPVRLTPGPGPGATLASRRGDGEGRAQGTAGGEGPGARLPAGPSELAPGDETRIAKDGDEAAGFVRPALPQGPAATEATTRALHPADDTDARLRSHDLHPHALAGIELSRAAAPGSGDTSAGPSTQPGFMRTASVGTAATPAGDAHAPLGEELWLRTGDRRYLGYFQRVYDKVKAQWVFPRKLAAELIQGEVVVTFTIRKDGRIDDIAVRKSSGFREFDDNVIRAVERAAPLPPVPAALGPRDLRVNAPFEYLNPLVR
jgi:TonB family protein